jgi:hypothetical protein
VAIIDNPARIVLHRTDSGERAEYINSVLGYPVPWFNQFDPCTISPRPSGTACDEYPNMASQEGGPFDASALGTTASLALINANHNSVEGGKLLSFYGKANGCDIALAAPAPPYVPQESSEFLVIPMPAWPSQGANGVEWLGLPTLWKCENGRIGGPGSS